MTVRILLVDDHDLIRSGLRAAFERDTEFAVVGEAALVATGLALVEDTLPDVVVIDINLPDGDGLAAVDVLRGSHPSLGLVVLTMYDDDEHLLGALEAGASAFVSKSAPTSEVLSAARHAASTPHSFSAANLVGALRRSSATSVRLLSDREQQVLNVLSSGATIARLASELHVSQSTAKTHVARLYEKLDATNRSQALMVAVQHGLLDVGGLHVDVARSQTA